MVLSNILNVDSRSIAVLPPKSIKKGSKPSDSFSNSFSQSLVEKPFIAYQPEFLAITGSNPHLKVVAEEHSYPFAHEAGVFIPSTREVFFTSNLVVTKGDKKKQVRVSKISVDNYRWTTVHPTPDIITPNGGTNYNGGLLLCSQGQDDIAGGLVFMDLNYNSIPIINNYYGRPFNSVNDVVVFPLDGSIWFTDPNYGQLQNLRPVEKLPNHVYSFDPRTGSVRVVADGIHKPNGISFSYDNKTCYITDTQTYDGHGGNDDCGVATIYAFDIAKSPHSKSSNPPYVLLNKRVFAYVDCGAPDGIKCDTYGNVYSGCQDGIHIWNSDGILIGKILVPGGIANFCFTDPGTLFLFNEHKIYEAKLNSDIVGALNTSL